ncbi:MAG TPA: hypothetical protein PLD23_05655 [Armatimonadota bacterium]|nr:hypothetical protein [Armatimonadota bacterium]
MRSVTALDLLFGLFRLTLAVSGLVWFVLEAGTVPIEGWVFWVIVAVFALYALLILAWSQQRPESAERVQAWSAFVDLALITFLVQVSGGFESFFWGAYVFVAAFHASYFGLGLGLAVSAASMLLLSTVLITHPEESPDWVRIIFQALLPVLAAFCCGVVNARQSMMRQQSVRWAIGARGSVASIHNAGLAVAQRVLELHALSRMSSSFETLRDLIGGAMGAARSVLEIEAYGLLSVDRDARCLVPVVQQGFPEAFESARPDLSHPMLAPVLEGREPIVWRDGPTALGDILGMTDVECGAAVAVPVARGDQVVGVLMACASAGQEIRARSLEALVAGSEQMGEDLAAFGEGPGGSPSSEVNA